MPKSVSDTFTKRCQTTMCGTTATKGRVVFPDALALLCPPGDVFRGQVAFTATLRLLVVSWICWCHFVPFSGRQWSGFVPEQVRHCSPAAAPPRCGPGSSCPWSSCPWQLHSHCTPCLRSALAGICQQRAGDPHKAGRVPCLVLFRCLRGLLSKMALTPDPAADGVAAALAGCRSHPFSSLTFFPLQRG